jgi:hypothetical protein
VQLVYGNHEHRGDAPAARDPRRHPCRSRGHPPRRRSLQKLTTAGFAQVNQLLLRLAERPGEIAMREARHPIRSLDDELFALDSELDFGAPSSISTCFAIAEGPCALDTLPRPALGGTREARNGAHTSRNGSRRDALRQPQHGISVSAVTGCGSAIASPLPSSSNPYGGHEIPAITAAVDSAAT